MPEPVLIVGAGPTGLVLALWLTRLGVPLRIIDMDEGPGETSRAMGVHARTLEFYSQLGIAEDVVAHGLKVGHVSIRNAEHVAGRVAFGGSGSDLSPYPFMLSFPQDEHERLLIAYLEKAGVSVERRTRLESFVQSPGGVAATLHRDGASETVETPYLCGCDGARSTTRQILSIGFPGGTYSHLFYVADAEVDGLESQDGIEMCMTGEAFCLVLPLRRAGSARLIGIVPDRHGADVTFADVAPWVARNTGITVRRVNWFSTYRVHHRVADRFRQDRVFLLGDAAHIHSPVGGQGMNTGIGDAVNLAWKLAGVLRGRTDARILDSYEPERIAFARKLVRSTDRMFQLVTRSGVLGFLWRSVVMARLVPSLFRLPQVPRRAFRAMSQIDIDYRSSPLSSGAARRVHAGDRLPWVKTEAGDNFQPLASLDWQIHVYGRPNPALLDVASKHGIEVHVFPWSSATDLVGLQRDALYLVRPDGYVGLADSGAAATLERYLEAHGIRPPATMA